ncbi:MAG: hypothetical protein IAG13_19755 [Deltaproteobacteria bacterium]|nr:hypothetical protein [Nannocystaceae bacterium]
MRLPIFAAAPLALSLVLATVGCPADDEEDTDTGADASSSNTAPSTTADDSGTADESGSADGGALGCALPEDIDGTDGATAPLQGMWGSACSVDADCVAVLGEGAECLDTAVVFELPGGYCAKPCVLPDSGTKTVFDDPTCDPDGGIACVGVKGTFEYCAPLCTDDAQCDRDGYICRQMPLVSVAADPSLCLMPDCCGEPQSAPTCAND